MRLGGWALINIVFPSQSSHRNAGNLLTTDFTENTDKDLVSRDLNRKICSVFKKQLMETLEFFVVDHSAVEAADSLVLNVIIKQLDLCSP